VKILDHPWTLDLVLRRSRNTCRSAGSTKSKDLDRGSAPSLNSLAPVEVAKFRNAPEFAMAGERAKIGAAVSRFGAPAEGSPARAVVAAAAAFVAASVAAAEAGRSILQRSNLFLHLLQESFSLGSHGGINSDRSSSVNDEGLKNLIAVRQCLVRQ
jgi:hypothetical protein